MLDHKEVLVDRAIVIEIPSDVEVIIKKKSRRSILKVLKDILSVESWDSNHKHDAMNNIHDRITFK